MAISEFEQFKVEKLARNFCDRRNKLYPPEQLYIDFRLENQSVTLFSIRPMWNDPSQKIECVIAKCTYVKSQGLWKLYWQRQNMKWHLYDDEGGSHKNLEVLLQVINDDPHECFWG